MFNPDLRDLLKDHTSRYSLVTAVAKRAREVAEDKELKEKCGTEKPVTFALDEFLDGELEIVEPEEIRDI
ncbi:MAG: DNA-directed RNA polymerase subunit omega [Oscillospiraceae bacterium]|nr:DNA-directed RNA polymerase subunit omega [Oscillospiraceae bacterium]MDD6527038.1 DNA-directed RNA polymerase subunit omega [Oscillospiraceae bacterium]